jgi:hypothetical protein
MHYQKDERLTALVENRRVVIVGPAQYLIGEKLGPIINGYDAVCRVNYLAPAKFPEFYGNRSDIMFYNCATLSLGQMKKHFQEYQEYLQSLKLVICPVVKGLGPDKWTTWGDGHISPVVDNFKSINICNNDFYWIGMKNYKYLFNLIGCREPNTGILAILTILEHGPKELFVTGFTFYADKNRTHFPGYATLPDNWKGVSGHPQDKQREFFKKYILSKGIKIDSYLNGLLKINHNNIEKL